MNQMMQPRGEEQREQSTLRNIVAKVRALRGLVQQGQPTPPMVGGGAARNAAEALQQRQGQVRNAIDEQTR
jgi:hypothetical protein